MTSIKEKEQIKKLFGDRKRTNILGGVEQKFISVLVKAMPQWVSPNILTGVGLFGSILVFTGFIFAKHVAALFLLLGIVGLFINWVGDSLDGRIAYYRNIPRKWFGFSLDIIMDWIATVFIGFGYFFYAPAEYQFIAFLFVVLYGWAMIISQLRYKITDLYVIDAGLVGPTEIRIVLALVIFIEYLVPNSIHYLAGSICAVLMIINIVDTKKLLKLGDIRDENERKLK